MNPDDLDGGSGEQIDLTVSIWVLNFTNVTTFRKYHNWSGTRSGGITVTPAAVFSGAAAPGTASVSMYNQFMFRIDRYPPPLVLLTI